MAKELRERGILADYYHADMHDGAREKVHMRYAQFLMMTGSVRSFFPMLLIFLHNVEHQWTRVNF